MPEGPEVKRMSQDLASEVSGKLLTSIEVLSGRYTKKPLAGLTEVNKVLPTKIIGAGCHGKFMFMLTSSGYNVWNTLGMTGRWSRTKTKHSRVEFAFESGSKIYFEDINGLNLHETAFLGATRSLFSSSRKKGLI